MVLETLSSVEIIALIIAVLAGIKILVILVNPKSWLKVVKFIYGNTNITMIVSLVLSVLVLYYLNQAGITIVEVFAVMTFMALLMALGVASYGHEIIALGSKMLKDRKVVKKAWLAILIWIALIIWLFYVLFV